MTFAPNCVPPSAEKAIHRVRRFSLDVPDEVFHKLWISNDENHVKVVRHEEEMANRDRIERRSSRDYAVQDYLHEFVCDERQTFLGPRANFDHRSMNIAFAKARHRAFFLRLDALF